MNEPATRADRAASAIAGALPARVQQSTPAVRAIGLRRTYGDVVALERLHLDVQPGEFFTMLGPSGSGKTTTLRLIAGFELPDSGAIELDGIDVTRKPPYQRDTQDTGVMRSAPRAGGARQALAETTV